MLLIHTYLNAEVLDKCTIILCYIKFLESAVNSHKHESRSTRDTDNIAQLYEIELFLVLMELFIL